MRTSVVSSQLRLDADRAVVDVLASNCVLQAVLGSARTPSGRVNAGRRLYRRSVGAVDEHARKLERQAQQQPRASSWRAVNAHRSSEPTGSIFHVTEAAPA